MGDDPNAAADAVLSDGAGLLDTLPEDLFDGIVALAAQSLRVPVAFFSIIDSQRIWFKSRYGSGSDQLDARGSFAAGTARAGGPLVVPDTAEDPRFAESDSVKGAPHIRFYAGVPVSTPDGIAIGMLCIVDLKPRTFDAEDLRLLESFAGEIGARVALRADRQIEQRLLDERVILMNMILHDARGILSSLRWSLDALGQPPSPPSDALVHSRQAVNELIRLCGSIHGLRDPEAARIKIEPRPENMRRWFELLGRRASRMANESGLTVVVDNGLPEGELTADIHVMDRVLMNLVRNACTAGAGGHGSSIYLEARVDIADDGSRALGFTVSDDGPGVPDEIRGRIFDPYFTFGRETSNGSGLGLAFARLAARALGGSIEFRSREPRGAEFVLRVPLEAAGTISNGA